MFHLLSHQVSSQCFLEPQSLISCYEVFLGFWQALSHSLAALYLPQWQSWLICFQFLFIKYRTANEWEAILMTFLSPLQMLRGLRKRLSSVGIHLLDYWSASVSSVLFHSTWREILAGICWQWLRFHLGCWAHTIVRCLRVQICFWMQLAVDVHTGGSHWWFKYLGPCNTHERPYLHSKVLVTAWPNLSSCRCMRSEPVGREPVKWTTIFFKYNQLSVLSRSILPLFPEHKSLILVSLRLSLLISCFIPSSSFEPNFDGGIEILITV